MEGGLAQTSAGRGALEAHVSAAFAETAELLSSKDHQIKLLVSANQQLQRELSIQEGMAVALQDQLQRQELDHKAKGKAWEDRLRAWSERVMKLEGELRTTTAGAQGEDREVDSEVELMMEDLVEALRGTHVQLRPGAQLQPADSPEAMIALPDEARRERFAALSPEGRSHLLLSASPEAQNRLLDGVPAELVSKIPFMAAETRVE
eukprot:TRINITY_DN6806_c0_g1_i1.p1 TRINITY_DN6806_c0_g1~~TRINITY_DN6806_c0_g1_i1.p1  ORF type:complete len:206 (+),score=65.67 TRINITY_DN6806_c0_g1_i1:221-838(+)